MATKATVDMTRGHARGHLVNSGMGMMVGRGWAEEIMCRRTAAVAISRPKFMLRPMHMRM